MTHQKFFFILIIFSLISCENKTTVRSTYIDNLSLEDTLKLDTHFADCGEWGGHKEHVCIYYKNESLLYTYKTDSVECMGSKSESSSIINVSYELTPKRQEIISLYIDSLIRFQKAWTDHLTSNGPNIYALKTNKDTVKLVIDDWNYFSETIEKLKDN